MSNTTDLNSSQKFGLKLLYTLSWGIVAAFTGALVASRFTLSVAEWAIFSSLMSAVTLSVAGLVTKDPRKAVGTLSGSFYAIIAGGLLGGLVWLCELNYPAVFIGVLGVAALSFTTWAVRTQQISLTPYARSSANCALVISSTMTAISILTGGFVATPTLQPILGALLGVWAVLLSIAFIDAQPVKTPAARS